MFQIVYVSDAVRPMGEDDLDHILTSARAFNAQAGVTGLLVYAQQSFLQVLEGDPESVEAAYAQVAASSRHRHLRRTSVHATGGRRFTKWSMGFQHAAPGDIVQALLTPLVDEGRLSHARSRGCCWRASRSCRAPVRP